MNGTTSPMVQKRVTRGWLHLFLEQKCAHIVVTVVTVVIVVIVIVVLVVVVVVVVHTYTLYCSYSNHALRAFKVCFKKENKATM